jgi:hypothetical protein
MATFARKADRRSHRRFIVMMALVTSSVLSPAAALAQTDPYSTNTPDVLPTRIGNEEPREAPSDPEERPSNGVLPATGAELTLFVVTGLAAIKTGATLVRRSKR